MTLFKVTLSKCPFHQLDILLELISNVTSKTESNRFNQSNTLLSHSLLFVLSSFNCQQKRGNNLTISNH